MFEPIHGGTDALGMPAHDFSTNRNACGPCPMALAALQAADAAQYPDPLYTDLRAQLAAFHGVEVRRIFSLRSACFTIDAQADGVTFRVTGYGHGVGMSQYGANELARQGKTWQEILTWYYAGITIGPVPETVQTS